MMFLISVLLLPQVINFLLALIPALILLRYFYKQDPRPEPRKTVFKAFVTGIIATIPAIFIEMVLTEYTPYSFGPVASAAYTAFIVAALTEESCKMYMVKKRIYHLVEFDEFTDGIVYTVAAGLGFAFFENILYSMNSPNSWTLLITRGLTAVPLHGLSSALMGYYIAKDKLEDGNFLFHGLMIAILYHGLYDFFLFLGGSTSWLVLPLLVILFLHARKLLGQAIAEDMRFHAFRNFF